MVFLYCFPSDAVVSWVKWSTISITYFLRSISEGEQRIIVIITRNELNETSSNHARSGGDLTTLTESSLLGSDLSKKGVLWV